MSICKDCIHYEICDEYVSPCESFQEVDGCKCFKNKADVVEVRHGVWHSTVMRNNECSLCHDKYHFTYPYCPTCGAKMDGERREQNEGQVD